MTVTGNLNRRFDGIGTDELLARLASPLRASPLLDYLLQSLDAVTDSRGSPTALEVGRAAWDCLADAYEVDHGTRPVTGGVTTFCDIPVRVRDDLPPNDMLWVWGR